MDLDRLRLNVKRHGVISALVAASIVWYVATGVVLLFTLLIPGLLVASLLVTAIPNIGPRRTRLVAIVTATVVGYLAVALTQVIVGLGNGPASVSPWSVTYVTTFLGLLAGLVFGCFAVLPSGRSRPAS